MGWDYDEDELDSGGRAKPGIYLAEVSEAELRRSSGGDAMGNIGMVEAKTRRFLCYDNIVLEGRGAGIGVKKALGLGVAERYEEDGKKRVRISDVPSWVGARAVVKLIEGSYKDKNGNVKKRLETDFDSDGFGYSAEDTYGEIIARSTPAEAPPPEDDDIPF